MTDEWKPDVKTEEVLDTTKTTEVRGSDLLTNTKDIRIRSGTQSYRVNEEGMFLGSEQFETAPFSVDMEGNMKASSGTFYGTISGGTISGVSISGGTISGGYISAPIISGGTIDGVSITGSSIQSIETFTTGEDIVAGNVVCMKNGYSTTLVASANCYVDEDHAATNYDNANTLMVGEENKTCYAFAKFDVGGAPDAEHILKAELHIKAVSTSGDPQTLTATRCTSDWNENGAVTWNAQPTVSALAEPGNTKTVANVQAYTDYYIDITELVRNWKVGIISNYGVRITGATAPGAADWANIGGRSNATVADRISLRITSSYVSDGYIYKADSDDYNLCRNIIGVATETKTSGNACKIQTSGKISIAGLTIGDNYFVSPTVGSLTNTVLNQTRFYKVGMASANNELLIDKNDSGILIEKSTDCIIATGATAQYIVFPPDSKYAIIEYQANNDSGSIWSGKIRMDITDLILFTVLGGAGGASKNFTLVVSYQNNGMMLTINSATANTLAYTVKFYK